MLHLFVEHPSGDLFVIRSSIRVIFGEGGLSLFDPAGGEVIRSGMFRCLLVVTVRRTEKKGDTVMHPWNDHGLISSMEPDDPVATKAIAENDSAVALFRNLVDFPLKRFRQISRSQVETIIQKSEIYPAILEWHEFPFHHSAGKNKQS
jgi:hypothetical protein